MATGPGLDRPLFKLGSEHAEEASYTMARTRKFYQDQMMGGAGSSATAGEPRLLHFASNDSPTHSSSNRTFLDSPRRMESLDSSLGSTGRTYG